MMLWHQFGRKSSRATCRVMDVKTLNILYVCVYIVCTVEEPYVFCFSFKNQICINMLIISLYKLNEWNIVYTNRHFVLLSSIKWLVMLLSFLFFLSSYRWVETDQLCKLKHEEISLNKYPSFIQISTDEVKLVNTRGRKLSSITSLHSGGAGQAFSVDSF